MLHRLTIGHLDPAAVERRQTVPTKALDMDVVHRHLRDLGERDADGAMTLGGCKLQFENGAVRCLGKVDAPTGSPRNSRFGCRRTPAA